MTREREPAGRAGRVRYSCLVSPVATAAPDRESDERTPVTRGIDAGRDRRDRPLGLAIALVVLGAVGFVAAFALTLDKLRILEDPSYVPGCNVSVLIGCSKNLGSAQGSIFGFPNPLLGLAGWTATIAVGVGVLAGARFARWFWLAYGVGVVGALALVVYLITVSLTQLFVLCPWCMVTWAVTIPTFWLTMLHLTRTGALPVPTGVRRAAGAAYGWVPVITLVSYAVVALLAQLQLDWLHRL